MHNTRFRCVCIAVSIEHRSRGHTAEITSKSRVMQRTTVLNWTAAGTVVGSDLYRTTCDTGIDTVFSSPLYTFWQAFKVADKSRVITYEPDGTNSARRLHSGSRVSLISAFLRPVRAPPPISDVNPNTPRSRFDRVRDPKIYTRENAPRPRPRRETINKFQSHRTEEVRSSQ